MEKRYVIDVRVVRRPGRYTEYRTVIECEDFAVFVETLESLILRQGKFANMEEITVRAERIVDGKAKAFAFFKTANYPY